MKRAPYRRISFVAAVLALSACGKKSDDSAATTANVIYLSGVSANNSRAASGLMLTTPTAPSAADYAATSIASGPADQFSLFVKSINLKDDTGSKTVPIFTATEAKEIQIFGNSVDLSGLFTEIKCLDSSGAVIDTGGKSCKCGLDKSSKVVEEVSRPDGTKGCPEVPEGGTNPTATVSVDQTGTFTKLTLELVSKMTVKGCTASTVFKSSLTVNGEHKYCTQSGKASVNGISATNSDFESTTASPKTADAMVLEGYGDTAIDFPIKGGVTIDGTSKPNITLLIDTNRFTRYYNGNETKDAPFKKGMSTKFDSPGFFPPPTIQNYLFTFVGRIGSMKGYSYVTSAQTATSVSAMPSDFTCTDSCKTITGWLTLLYDVDGKPMVATFSQDDDNALLTLKGSNKDASGTDSTLISSKGSSSYDITFKLGTDTMGTVYSLVDSGAIDSTQTLNWKHSAMDTSSGGKLAYGKVKFTRKF